MGTTQQHKEKADHHLAFLATISDDYPDWQATVAFYSAVELVEAVFAVREAHSKSHEDRKRFVRSDYVRIFKPYHALYNASLNARYEAMEHWLSPEAVRSKLIDRHLEAIKSFMTSRLDKANQERKGNS